MNEGINLPFCSNCGAEITPDTKYCPKCGIKLDIKPISTTDRIAGPSKIYTPRPYHPSMKAPLVERFVASLVDGVINNVCCLYECFKDGIRDGQSIGKGLLDLRVIKFETGEPATVEDSLVRNCFCGCIDFCCCYITVLLDADGRRFGDHMAGTVVIKDT